MAARKIKPHNDPIVRCNVLRHPARILVKQIKANADGTLDKNRGGQIPRGSTISTTLKPLSKYVQDAFDGGVHQYILPANVDLGIDIPISPKEFVVEGGVDRTGATLRYVDGPAMLTFDHDPSSYARVSVNGPQELHKILVEQFPDAFTSAGWSAYDSSGSYIFGADGTELAGRRGFHVVFAVENATELLKFGDRLFKRLWLLGFGYIHISRNGTPLPRTIFDKKVIEPQQPIFAGGAHCIECEQRRPPPEWHPGGYINTAGIAELTHEEEREFKRLVEVAKREAQPERERMRREYDRKAAADLVSKRGISVEHARRVVETRHGGTLIGSDLLFFDDHGDVTVAEVLANLEVYDEATLADPIDGDIAGKAILFINADTGTPIVYSHAHGGSSFFLKHDLSSLLGRLDKMEVEAARQEWLSGLRIAELRCDELDQYFTAVKSKTGIGIGALRKAASELKSSAVLESSQDLKQDPGVFLANLLLEQQYAAGSALLKLESGHYWHYTGTHWCQIRDSILSSQLQVIAQTQWGRVLSMWAFSGKKSTTLASLVSSALTCLGNLVVTPGDPLRLNDTRPSVINCINGELWLMDNGSQLRTHCPDSYLTSCSPIIYDPLAVAPTFEMAMRGILSLPGGIPMPDQDSMLRHIEELLGYTIQTRRDHKAFILIVGPGDNGKTAFIKLLRIILGDSAIAFDRLAGVNEGGNRFATSRLVGKLVLIDDDVDYEYLLPDGLLKKIAEEKPLTAEGKFKDSFQFVAQVVPILLGNTWPKSRDLTRGMQTRANVLHLPRSFLKPGECQLNDPDRQRPELWQRVYKEEMPGVLNRLIDGYYRFVACQGFSPPISAQRAFDMWLAEANVVARFIEDACDRIDPTQPGCTTTMAFEAFIMWSDSNGVQPRHRPQQNQLKKRLQEIGLRVGHTDHGTGVYGIKIKSQWAGSMPNPFSDKAATSTDRKALRKV